MGGRKTRSIRNLSAADRERLAREAVESRALAVAGAAVLVNKALAVVLEEHGIPAVKRVHSLLAEMADRPNMPPLMRLALLDAHDLFKLPADLE